MFPVRTLVKDGRLTLIEHEGRDDDDRAALQAELEASLGEAEAGETVDFSAALTKLRQRP